MKTLMADGQVHYDVINKLWQVYSAWSFAEGNLFLTIITLRY